MSSIASCAVDTALRPAVRRSNSGPLIQVAETKRALKVFKFAGFVRDKRDTSDSDQSSNSAEEDEEADEEENEVVPISADAVEALFAGESANAVDCLGAVLHITGVECRIGNRIFRCDFSNGSKNAFKSFREIK